MSAGVAITPPDQGVSSRLDVSDVATAVSRVRVASDSSGKRMADVVGRAFELWRDRDYPRRRVAIGEIVRAAGFSVAMLEASIDALLKPFTRHALIAMAAHVSMISNPNRPKTMGFIAAGNIAGAGIHEIAIALIAGAGVVIKTASAEPIFIAEFARTIGEVDKDAGRRVEALRWGRERADLTAALVASCDLVVAYGDDATIETLRRPNVVGFGSRVSAAIVATEAIGDSEVEQIAKLLAHDVALFEQLGCLSPHQIFVLCFDDSPAHEFAVRMANALETISNSMPPALLPIRDAAEIRMVRERTRWRAIAGEPIELFESRGFEWTAVLERHPEMSEPFKISPGFRTVHMTAVHDLAELRRCLAGMTGRIEAMAVAGDESGEIRSAITQMRIPYVCAPGEMQSPPLEWAHGGGAFFDAILGER
jgi:hypothetical protein